MTTPRFWIVFLWAFTVAGGFGAGYWAYEYFHAQAARQTILLVPDQALDEIRRNELALKLGAEPCIASATWLAPADQTQRLQSQFPDERWKEAYPADANWLPWVLEVKPADPLGNRDLLTAFIAKRHDEGGWQVYWDGSTLDELGNNYKNTGYLVMAWIAVTFLSGVIALARMPRPERPIRFTFESTILVGASYNAMMILFNINSEPVQSMAAFLSMFICLILACIISPMLGLRRIPGRSVESTFSTTVAEAPDERVR